MALWDPMFGLHLFQSFHSGPGESASSTHCGVCILLVLHSPGTFVHPVIVTVGAVIVCAAGKEGGEADILLSGLSDFEHVSTNLTDARNR